MQELSVIVSSKSSADPAHQLQKTPRQLAAIEDNHRAAHLVDDVEDLIGEPGTEQGDDGRDAQKPQHRRAGKAADEKHVAAGRQAGPERPQHHGAVDNGLRIEPCHHAGGGDHLPDGHVHVPTALHAGFGAQKSDTDPDDDETADAQNDLLQPGKGLHQRADAQKAGKTQCDVEKDDDQRRQIGPAALLGQGGVDDEQVLQADGRHIGKAHRQALKINIHGVMACQVTICH